MTRARTTRARLINFPILTFAAVLSASLFVGLPAVEAAKSKAPSAGVDQVIKTGIEALEAGRVDLAVQELTSAITGGKISQSKLAQALYYRGLAYRKQKKPAQAIADLTSALWIKNGLDGEQRADALLNRAAAYRDAGLTEQAEADERRVAADRRARAAGMASADSGRPAAATPTPAASSSSGGGFGSFFSSLFGGSSGSPEPASQGFATSVSRDAPVDRQTAAANTGRSPEVSGWTNKSNPAAAGWAESTMVRKASATGASQRTPATTASTGKAAAGGQFVQVAAVRSRAEAQAVAAQLSKMGATSGAWMAAIDETVMGNMGTLYSVRLGPLASGELNSVCPQLRDAGLDCMVVSR